MFYPVCFLRMPRNRKGRLPACWLAATTKEFMGTGSYKLSKKEVIDIDVCLLCDDIIDGIVGAENTPRFSLYLSSQLTYGVSRIYKQQVDILEEMCKTLHMEILAPTKLTNKKKSSQTSVEKAIYSDHNVTELDIEYIFQKDKVDEHLILEEDICLEIDSAPQFYDNECDSIDIRRFPSPPLIRDVTISENIQEISTRIDFNSEQETRSTSQNLSAQVTPKRKSHKPHTETPSKRKRIPLPLSQSPSESAKSPIVRSTPRRLDLNHELPSELRAESAISGDFPIDQDIALPIDIVENQIEEAQQEVPNRATTKSTVPTIIETPAETSTTTNEFRGTSGLLQTRDQVSMPSLDRFMQYEAEPEQRETELPAVEDLHLVELDEESLSSFPLRRRKKSKKKLIIDTVKQIPYVKRAVNAFTRASKVNIHAHVPANILLQMPSKRERIEINISKIQRAWALNLENHFREMIKSPCIRVETPMESRESPRVWSANVNKRRRLSDFQKNFSSAPTTPQRLSSKSIQLSAHYNVENENVDQDMTLMPPPPLNFAHLQSPSMIRGILESTSAASPQQESRRSTDWQQLEPLVASDPGVQAELPTQEFLPEPEQNMQSKLQDTDSSEIVASSVSSESHMQDFIMSMDEFYTLLVKMWEVAADYLKGTEELVKIELDDILIPSDTSIEELIKYCIYCFEFEKKLKLYIEQQNPYGPVFIIKL